MKVLYTVFKSKRLDEKKHQWSDSIYFLHGPESKYKIIDFKTDWRFCEVKGLRSQSEILGEVKLDSDKEFPIKYPLKLNNNIEVLNKYGRTGTYSEDFKEEVKNIIPIKNLVKIELPIEEGKSYFLTWQDKQLFHVTKIEYNKERTKITNIKGIYDRNKDLGECSIPNSILVPETIEFEE